MIGDKLTKAFYLVSVRGDAIKTFFDGDFGIDNILISSDLFPDDLTAGVALGNLVQYIASDPEVSMDGVSEDVELNPEFFPSVEPIKVTEEMQEQYDSEVSELKSSHSLPENAIPVIMTKNFDELGDFFMTRWKIHSDTLDVTARIGIVPSEFMYLKSITGDDPMLIEHREGRACKTILQ